MNNILKSCIVLFVISSVCVSALAYINEITKEPIRIQEELAENNAYKELFPNADTFKKGEAAFTPDETLQDVIVAYVGSERKGYIVKLSEKGYGGPINMLTGIDGDGAISGIVILSHSETAGLGANCEKEWFTERYKGKNQFPLSVVKIGAGENEIDSITSATITTKAVTDAVNAAYEWYVTEGGGK